MAPQLSKQAIEAKYTKAKYKTVDRYLRLLEEPDFTPSGGPARVVNLYRNSALMGRYDFLADQVRRRSDGLLEPDDLQPGQIVMMINRQQDKMAILLPERGVYFGKSPHGKYDLDGLNQLARSLKAESGFDLDPVLRREVLLLLEGREEAPEPKHRGAQATNKVALDTVNRARGTVIRDE